LKVGDSITITVRSANAKKAPYIIGSDVTFTKDGSDWTATILVPSAVFEIVVAAQSFVPVELTLKDLSISMVTPDTANSGRTYVVNAFEKSGENAGTYGPAVFTVSVPEGSAPRTTSTVATVNNTGSASTAGTSEVSYAHVEGNIWTITVDKIAKATGATATDVVEKVTGDVTRQGVPQVTMSSANSEKVTFVQSRYDLPAGEATIKFYVDSASHADLQVRDPADGTYDSLATYAATNKIQYTLATDSSDTSHRGKTCWVLTLSGVNKSFEIDVDLGTFFYVTVGLQNVGKNMRLVNPDENGKIKAIDGTATFDVYVNRDMAIDVDAASGTVATDMGLSNATGATAVENGKPAADGYVCWTITVTGITADASVTPVAGVLVDVYTVRLSPDNMIRLDSKEKRVIKGGDVTFIATMTNPAWMPNIDATTVTSDLGATVSIEQGKAAGEWEITFTGVTKENATAISVTTIKLPEIVFAPAPGVGGTKVVSITKDPTSGDWIVIATFTAADGYELGDVPVELESNGVTLSTNGSVSKPSPIGNDYRITITLSASGGFEGQVVTVILNSALRHTATLVIPDDAKDIITLYYGQTLEKKVMNGEKAEWVVSVGLGYEIIPGADANYTVSEDEPDDGLWTIRTTDTLTDTKPMEVEVALNVVPRNGNNFTVRTPGTGAGQITNVGEASYPSITIGESYTVKNQEVVLTFNVAENYVPVFDIRDRMSDHSLPADVVLELVDYSNGTGGSTWKMTITDIQRPISIELDALVAVTSNMATAGEIGDYKGINVGWMYNNGMTGDYDDKEAFGFYDITMTCDNKDHRPDTWDATKGSYYFILFVEEDCELVAPEAAADSFWSKIEARNLGANGVERNLEGYNAWEITVYVNNGATDGAQAIVDATDKSINFTVVGPENRSESHPE